jgi:hypothetical protein
MLTTGISKPKKRLVKAKRHFRILHIAGIAYYGERSLEECGFQVERQPKRRKRKKS